MKLEPVFLLAPDPEPPTPQRLSRRGVLAGIGLLGLGAVAGVGISHAIQQPDPIRTEDPMVAFALQLQEAPIAEFLAGSATFLHVVAGFPESASRLRPGVSRLASAALDSAMALPAGIDRAGLARDILSVARPSGPASTSSAGLDVGTLERLSRLAR